MSGTGKRTSYQSGDWNLLLGKDQLAVNGEGTILLSLQVSGCDSLGPFSNSAFVMGVSPSGEEVMDESVDGSDPNPDGDDNDPTDDEGSTDFE